MSEKSEETVEAINPQKILNAISNEVRVEILKLLSRKNPLSFTEIMEERGLKPSQDAGRFGYHLRELRKARLIKGGPDIGYQLTSIGEKVVEFLWTLIDLKSDETYIPVRTSGYAIEHFDKNKIVRSLMREASVPENLALEIAAETEERLMKANIKYLTAPLIREAVNFILIEKGYENYRHLLTRLGLPPYDITEMLSRIKDLGENFNPEMMHKNAGDAVMEQYLLLNILDHNIADGYLSGDFYIPNANYFILRSNTIHHDIRWFLKDGLNYNKSKNILTIFKPKKFFNVLNLLTHLLNLSQIYISGTQVIDFFNVFILPYIKNINKKEIKENLLIFFSDIANSYNARGGQLISSCLQLELEMPNILKNLEAIGPGGNISGNYGDYVDEFEKLLQIYLEVLKNGIDGKYPINIPAHIFKINKNIIDNKSNSEIIDLLLKIIKKWGGINFINTTPKWQDESVSFTDSLERIPSRWDKNLVSDYTAVGNLEWIILNLPRIAIESKGIRPKFFGILNDKVEKCIEALNEKIEEFKRNMLDFNNLPFFKYKVNGLNYFNINECTQSISYVGIYECAHLFLGKKADFDEKIRFIEEILKYIEDLLSEKNETLEYQLNIKQAIEGKWCTMLPKLDKLRFKDSDIYLIDEKE
ncbi:MAG: anaerobic ribonucleoside-triphosphate reductase, partial [Candidatus Helarchaeota archaeon]